MTAMSKDERAAMPVEFKLDGRDVVGHAGETILQAARRYGIEIPHLCYKDGLRPDGNCRACVVEVKGERVLAPSCCRTPTKGMEVATDNARALASQKMVLELLLSDMPESRSTLHSELDHWARKLGIGKPRFAPRHQPGADLSHHGIAVNLDSCIQCTRCLRACREEQVNDVIGYAFRGEHSKIVFDFDDPMGNSTCVACGECVQACPTGALMPARGVGMIKPDKQVHSVCPYCGVGCQLTYAVKDNKILYVDGRDGPSNHERLCVKGRYGFDYVHHKQRLTKPLIRKPGVPKHADFTLDPANPLEHFREASWEEALDLTAGKLTAIRDRQERQERARRLRLRQGHQRGGVSVPEAGAHRLRLEQRGSLHAAVPCLERRRADGGDQLGRGIEPGERRRARGGDLPHRREPGVEPPGGGDLDQECSQERHEADLRRPAPLRAFAPRAHHAPVQARHRRRAAERDDAHDRARGTGQRGFHPEPHPRLRRAEEERCGLQPGGDGADLRHSGRDHQGSGAALRPVEGFHDPVGHGHLAACPRHRQRAVPDCAHHDHRPDRPARHRAAPSARAEQRAGRVRFGADPDGVPGLPARGQSPRRGRASRSCGARRSTPSRD